MRIYLNEPVSINLIEKLNKKFILTKDIFNCEIIISRNQVVDKNIIDNNKFLKIIAVHGTGYNMIDLDYAKEKGIIVFRTPFLNVNAVSELNVMLMLNLARKYDEVKKTRILGDINFLGEELRGKTVGIIGLGHIGIRTKEILYNGFGCNIIGYNRTKKDIPNVINVSLEELYKKSDYIVLALALTDATKEMINKDAFLLMEKKPYIINSARGALINNCDLKYALKNNLIKGFGCDTYYPEPVMLDDDILNYNTIILPHIGANTKEALDEMGERLYNNLINILDGIKIDDEL